MSEWVIQIVGALGYAGIAFLTLLENVFPPIPSELIMPLAGYQSSMGNMSLAAAIAAGSMGSLLGGTAWYFVGKRIGERRLRQWVEDHGRWLTLTCRDIDRASDWFHRHGASAVFIGRLIPGLRTWISVPAGIHGMPLPKFLVYSAAGTVIWTALLTVAGYWVGASFGNISKPIGIFANTVLVAAAVYYVYRFVTYDRRVSERVSESR
jgi:membrane protein DedA with SNARE-associated domain